MSEVFRKDDGWLKWPHLNDRILENMACFERSLSSSLYQSIYMNGKNLFFGSTVFGSCFSLIWV